jgi:fumarate hydratase subunit alpha
VCAIGNETNKQAQWVLSQTLENAKVACQRCSPLCDDTGIPHLFLEVGPNQVVTGQLIEDIKEGVRQGLRELPGRPMAVKGDDIQRIEQSEGLYEDSAALEAAPIVIRNIEEDELRLTVLMLGGGPAIRGITQSVFHKHSIQVVVDEIVRRASEGVKKLGCTPCTLAIGVGRSQYEATNLMMEAMVKGDFGVQSDLEKEITARVNDCEVGPLGLGGRTSVLATFLKVGPQRASGVRIVAIRPCCCVEPRRATVKL